MGNFNIKGKEKILKLLERQTRSHAIDNPIQNGPDRIKGEKTMSVNT